MNWKNCFAPLYFIILKLISKELKNFEWLYQTRTTTASLGVLSVSQVFPDRPVSTLNKAPGRNQSKCSNVSWGVVVISGETHTQKNVGDEVRRVQTRSDTHTKFGHESAANSCQQCLIEDETINTVAIFFVVYLKGFTQKTEISRINLFGSTRHFLSFLWFLRSNFCGSLTWRKKKIPSRLNGKKNRSSTVDAGVLFTFQVSNELL